MGREKEGEERGGAANKFTSSCTCVVCTVVNKVVGDPIYGMHLTMCLYILYILATISRVTRSFAMNTCFLCACMVNACCWSACMLYGQLLPATHLSVYIDFALHCTAKYNLEIRVVGGGVHTLALLSNHGTCVNVSAEKGQLVLAWYSTINLIST